LLFAAVYLASFASMAAYGARSWRRPSAVPFRATVWAYAALLGIQILQNGQFMTGLGLSEGLLLFVNAANLIAFANVVRFSGGLADKRLACGYLAAAVVLKLAAELVLIVAMLERVQAYQVLLSLSAPILGAAILVAYLSRASRLDAAEL